MLKLAVRPFKMLDDETYSLLTVRRENRGIARRGFYKGQKVLVKSQFLVSTDDFVISKRQIVHRACGLVPDELDGSIVSNEYNVFRPSSETCITFFDFFCHRPEMEHQFFLSCVGVHLEKMLFRTNDWLKRQFYFPTLPEQRKISDFLTAVDGRISQLTEKKALLEKYKKGVMQQLFSQAIRFKDDHGNDFPDWEEKKLGEACSFIKDGTHGTHPDDDTSDYLLLSAKNIKNGKVTLDQTDRRISEKEYGSIYKNYALERGDILLTVVGTIGRVAIYKDEAKIAFQRSVAFLRFDEDSPNFMYQQFCHEFFQKALLRRQVTSAQPGIYLGDIAKISVFFPCADEQTKIANFLSAIDRKIESVATQITETQTFKRGLLQQMFV